MTDTVSKFSMETPVFQGPLETLLDLIEARKMSISDISLAEVTDAYLVYIEQLPELPLAETSQFILVASTLLLIKSRTLLPTLDFTVEEKESVEELERRLARLRIVRAAAKLLQAQWNKSPLLLMKRAPVRRIVFSPGEVAIQALYSAAQGLMRTIPKPEKMVQAAVAPVLALEDVVKDLHKRLSSAIRARFSDLTKGANKSDVIVHFLAVLELVRAGSASVTQDKLFSDISIEIETVSAPRYGV